LNLILALELIQDQLLTTSINLSRLCKL